MLHDLTIHAAADLLRAGEISSVQLTEALIDRIAGVDNDVKAYLTLLPELALEQAAAADRAIAAARGGIAGRVAAAHRHPARDQGRDHRRGRADHLRLEDSGELRCAISGHGHRQARRMRARFCWARPTPTSSRWAPAPRTRPISPRITRGTSAACPADRAGAARPRSPRANAWARWAAIPAAACASRHRIAASSG